MTEVTMFCFNMPNVIYVIVFKWYQYYQYVIKLSHIDAIFFSLVVLVHYGVMTSDT
jgi:hypothetical protein